MHTWNLPRYVTYDLRCPGKRFRVVVQGHYIGNYVTLKEARDVRDLYCIMHGVQVKEKLDWQ